MLTVTLQSRGIVRIQIVMLDTSGFETNIDDSGPYAQAVVMIRLNVYEFRFRQEADDFVLDPNFKPFSWQQKDDDVNGDSGNGGMGKGPESSARPANTLVTSMDVDSSQSVGAAPHGKFVAPNTLGLSNIAVMPLNPSPHMPHGIEIVERTRRISPELFAKPSSKQPS
jgi:hypothetical protein